MDASFWIVSWLHRIIEPHYLLKSTIIYLQSISSRSVIVWVAVTVFREAIWSEVLLRWLRWSQRCCSLWVGPGSRAPAGRSRTRRSSSCTWRGFSWVGGASATTAPSGSCGWGDERQKISWRAEAALWLHLTQLKKIKKKEIGFSYSDLFSRLVSHMKKLNISQDFSFTLFSTKRKKKKNLRNKEENLLKFVFCFNVWKRVGKKTSDLFSFFFKEKKSFPCSNFFPHENK